MRGVRPRRHRVKRRRRARRHPLLSLTEFSHILTYVQDLEWHRQHGGIKPAPYRRLTEAEKL